MSIRIKKIASLLTTRLVSRQDLGVIWGVDPSRVSQLAQLDGFPLEQCQRDVKGRLIKWPLVACNLWYLDWKTGTSEESLADLKREEKREHVQQERIKTVRMLREEEYASGNILPRDEKEVSDREHIGVARDTLMALPRELARLLPEQYHAKIQSEGERIIRRTLERLATELDHQADDEDE